MATTNNKRFILSGGGTGGHIFPAVAIAKELMHRYGANTEILFVGAIGKMEMTRIPEAGFNIVGLPVEGLIRSISPKNIVVLAKAVYSLIKARRIIKSFHPHAVIGTGGYVSLPVCFVASRMHVPVILQEQNGFAGLTNKLVGSKAQIICTGFPSMDRFFPRGNWIFTGNPVRDAIIKKGSDLNSAASKIPFVQQAAEKWGLNPNLPIIFITGGSLGAKTINETILENLEILLAKGIQLIWQTGERFWKSHHQIIQQQITSFQHNGIKTPIYYSSFIDSMELAMSASSLIISRAGAITLSEIAIIGTPAILVPSPNVTDDHQSQNAKVLQDANAAVLVTDVNCKNELVPTAMELLEDSHRLNNLSKQLLTLAKPHATETIVDQIHKAISSKNA